MSRKQAFQFLDLPRTMPQRIPVELRGDTRWKMVGNGREINRKGLAPRGWPSGQTPLVWPAGWKGEIPIPPLESVILMNGF